MSITFQAPPRVGSGTQHLPKIEDVVCPVLRAHGLDLFDLSLRREQVGWVLRVVVDRPQGSEPSAGITVQLCAELSRDLSTALDVSDPIPHAYTLEVSSPGLDRPLRGAHDFERFEGKLAKLVLAHPCSNGQHVLRGRLAGVRGKHVILQQSQGELTEVPLSDIKSANLVFELLARPKKKTNPKHDKRPSHG